MASTPPAGSAQGSATPAPPRERAVLDSAHGGEIRGAFGTIRHHEEAHRNLRSRALALLAIIGPGVIVMVGDNDAGGVATYSQAGQNYGTSLLWVLLLLIPVVVVNQEMAARLGAVTGVGHARLIFERFGRSWGWFEVANLFLLNFLTIVTEFIGVSLALGYFGISKYVAVPVATAALVAVTVSGSFRLWERSMFIFVAGNLLLVPLFFLSDPSWGNIAHDFVVPSIQGGATSTSVLMVIAIVGTTITPWQLFFQQSNVVDKRITPRWINYERIDTWIGTIVVVIGAAALMCTSAFAFSGTKYAGSFTDAGGTAVGLEHAVGSSAGALFAIVLLNASLIGAGAVTLCTSYAFGDAFGTRGSLHRSFSDAKGFYAMFALLIVAAAGIVLIPGAPLGLITEAVQALAGVLLPAATIFLLMLCNDHEVLGPWRNPPWLNALASVVVGTIVTLSVILTITTIFPHVDVKTLALVAGGVLALSLALLGLWSLRAREGAEAVTVIDGGPEVPREQWTMPPAALLSRPQWSTGRRIAMLALQGYVVAATILLAVKVVQLAGA